MIVRLYVGCHSVVMVIAVVIVILALMKMV